MVFRNTEKQRDILVYLAPINQFRGAPRTVIEDRYSQLRQSTRNALEQAAGEPAIPVAIEGTMVWREEDEQEPAWPGETFHQGRVERGSIDHIGVVG
jgi:hypothetical protein